ncbi:MAG: bifunctional diaminohydroxyphosphoribosylaminopyrimidine deaminase/5-amino-6-(5-phosphoribosylamino)uracil reductase RibD [Thiotrichaceae bacterium]|nr:bifunctional diaminohydroxyphosphoribosylaminopyrimidine deaminase/5-amino-6-(5-phosphoribosylamino)uracil reductase RibD [Thiotrichaceae bacterium]
MTQAMMLARRGNYTTHPNPRVGCVLVQEGKVIAEGWHHRAGDAHAEVDALDHLSSIHLAKGATAYVTLEPCSHTGRTAPCSQALIVAGVVRVVVAMQDPNPLVAGRGLAQLREAGITVECGLLETEARELNLGFIKRMEQGLPWVSVKLAMSLDGRTAMASNESQWITGEPARKDVQFLRAKSSAILTGQGTVLADDPSLNVRLDPDELSLDGEIRQPIRVVLDPELAIPLNAKMLTLRGETLIFCLDSVAEEAKEDLQNVGVTIIALAGDEANRLPLREVLQELARREINEIHVEAGAALCGALVSASLVDQLVIYMAPHLMGSNARGLLDLPNLEQMKDRMSLEIKEIRAIAKDWRIIAVPIND